MSFELRCITYLPCLKAICLNCRTSYELSELVKRGYVKSIIYEQNTLQTEFYCDSCGEWKQFSTNLFTMNKDIDSEYIGYNTYVISIDDTKRLFFKDVGTLSEIKFTNYKLVGDYVILSRIHDKNVVLDLKHRKLVFRYLEDILGTLDDFLNGTREFAIVRDTDGLMYVYNREFQCTVKYYVKHKYVFEPHLHYNLSYIACLGYNHIYKCPLDSNEESVMVEVDEVLYTNGQFVVVKYHDCITEYDTVEQRFLPGTEMHPLVISVGTTYSMGVGVKGKHTLNSECNTTTIYNKKTGEAVEIELEIAPKIYDWKTYVYAECMRCGERDHFVLKLKNIPQRYVVTYDMDVIRITYDNNTEMIRDEDVISILKKVDTQKIIESYLCI